MPELTIEVRVDSSRKGWSLRYSRTVNEDSRTARLRLCGLEYALVVGDHEHEDALSLDRTLASFHGMHEQYEILLIDGAPHRGVVQSLHDDWFVRTSRDSRCAAACKLAETYSGTANIGQANFLRCRERAQRSGKLELLNCSPAASHRALSRLSGPSGIAPSILALSSKRAGTSIQWLSVPLEALRKTSSSRARGARSSASSQTAPSAASR